MRGLVVALLCFACHVDAPASDAGGDAQSSFEHPIGSGCDAEESLLCARGAGICHKGVCCAFCNAADVPHCPDGMMEVHQTSGNRDVCLCAIE